MKSERRSQAGAFPVVPVFGVLLVLVVAGAALLLIRPGQPPAQPAQTPQATPSATPTDHSLTDAEAIAEFRRLDKLRQRALEKRDLALVSEVFTSTSPSAPRLKKTIRRLRRERVVAEEQLQTLRSSVLRNESNEVVLKQVLLLDIIFRDQSGRDVTADGGKERQTVRWVLRFEDARWRLHDGLITAARPVS